MKKISVDCQNPSNRLFIERVHVLVEGNLDKGSDKYNDVIERAGKLAAAVNPGAANASEMQRDKERVMQDALAGMIAEQSWLAYINHTFGGVANPTAFETANGQIDIRLDNGELLEVRSSFVRNGIKFGVCSDKYNFNVIGAYSNLYKAGEVQKDYYLLVLFETEKNKILTSDTIKFGLIAGATNQMMKDNGYNSDLVADGDITAKRTTYRLLRIKNAHDINEFDSWMESIGYPKS